MATSPAIFCFGFVIVSIILLWMIFIFCSKLFAWMLGASVKFRVGGLKCLRDVVVKFEKGAIESVSVGEIKLSLRQFLIKLKDPKMQVLICDLEVVMRSSTSTTNLQNYESQKSRSSGGWKWIVVANVARFLSVSITDMAVKTPKVIVEVKELNLDISKDDGKNPNLYVKLNVLQFLVYLCESHISLDQSSKLGFESCSSSASPDRSSPAIVCDELSLSTEFGHDREVGIIMRNVEVISGDVILNFDEDSFPENKQSVASIQDEVRTPSTTTTTTSSAKKPHKEHQLLAALEKVSFRSRKLEVIYRENGLVAENNITGIILNVKSKSFEDTGESTRLDIEMELSEIHLLRKDKSSIVKIMKVDMVSFVDIPIQPDQPIRAEVDVKVGGTQCDLLMSTLQPWLRLHGGTHGGTHTLEKSKAADMVAIMWRGTGSTPDMTVILYSLDDLPMYHFSLQPSLVSANNISSTGKTIHVEVGELNLQLADETHTSSLLSYASDECKRLKYSVSLEISHFSFCLNKASHSILLKLVRAKSIYKEYIDEHKTCSKVTLFDMHNVKFERRSNCSLFTATDISLSWEPDVHLSIYELFLWLRSLVYALRLKGRNKVISANGQDVDEQKEKESVFVIDVDMLTISAKVKDDVEIKLEVKSLFSEKVSIGVILEESILTFNGSRVFKSTRMQVSRILGKNGGLWDLVVQGSDVYICLPYKLKLRAIADSIDEMLRGLKLITVEEEENIFPGKVETSKPKGYSPSFGRIRFYVRRITVGIEEEPMQGWLDEHYQLMKKEACEVTVRLKFLHKETSDFLAIQEATEEIHKQSFQSYYKACKGLVPSEGSGACREGFQAGFKQSAARSSLLSVCATDFDLSLTSVHGDDAGMMEVLKKLDPICQENEKIFSRLSGNNVSLKTGSLVFQLRDYTLPFLSCTSGKCEGRIVQLRAQQGDEEKCKSSGQPQISQDVFVGRWRKVKMFQSASDTPQPMKTYSDLRIQFEKGEFSFGVGYEPAFADISYAISVALGSIPPVIEEEESLLWWDNMRNNFHGNISLSFSESKWTVLATTDPYESRDKLQIVTGPIEFQQSDGQVFVNTKDFKIKLSSLESMTSRHSLEVPHSTSEASFFEAPVFTLEVKMDWYCESENDLNVFDPFRSTSLSLQCNFSIRPENESIASASPTMNLGAHDLAWMLKFCGMNSDPPNKLRSFSRWPRFGVPRVAIQESLSLYQVMTELMLRVDVTPYLIKYMPWDYDDPAKGLTLSMKKLKYELCFSRGKQKYTFECNRDALDLVYQSLDLRVVKAFINKYEHHRDEGFLLSSDYLTIKRQAPKADHGRLLAWQEAGRRNLGNGSESDEHIGSDSSDDDDGYNLVIADNCQRVFVHGLKLLWTIQNRDAVRSFSGGISKAFEPPKPSPSRQYTQMKILEENQKESFPETHQDIVGEVETSDSEEEGTQHFMVNIIKPQFNLHSEEANGRFLLAANSGRVLARSFHSIIRVGMEVIEHALGTGSFQIPECSPEVTWKRREFSIMLEHVQAHVAPTDTDPGAGLQWLPKIRRNHPNVKRTGALLESVFMPCDMYLRYTRHKAGTPDLKVKPLKEITFNSRNITATMTSRQFQIMMDVLTNLLFARLPKPRKSNIQCSTEDEDEDVEEEADEVVPYGVEEVEIAKINLEEKEQERKLLLDDIRKLSHCSDNVDDTHMEREGEMWMISTKRSILVQGLKNELLYAQNSRKAASASLRMELQKAAQLRLFEKEKNKSPAYAMSISLQINKVVWSMLVDGKPFAEAEIHDMIYDFDRDYKDIGIARFTTKYFVVRNCLPNAKSDMFLSAWNPPPEWGKKFMLRVDSKQGAPKDGNYPFELFQVEIYPLRIHLTERLYTMMLDYIFPGEEQDLQRREVKIEVWKSSRMSSTMQSQSNVEFVQKSNTLNLRPSTSGSAQELRRTSSFDRTWEETVAESVANELILQPHSSKQKLNETKTVKSHEEAKTGKSRPRKIMEFHNIKISQVELLVTYEGTRVVVSDLRLLMDTFHRVEFTGTWRRLFSRVKKHIIWGVLKSLTGMQGKKFKYNSYKNLECTDNDLNLSDDDQTGKPDQQQVTWFKRQSDGAGDGFVTSIRGLFNTQRRKGKAFVLRTMRGEAENDIDGEWSDDSDVEFSPFARQLTITKAKKLIKRHTKKFRPTSQRGSTSQKGKSLPEETTAFEGTGYSSGSSSYEDFHG